MKKYIIELSAEERHELQRLLRSGKTAARKATRARILLKADDGLSDEQIAEEVSTSVPTIERVRKRFVEESLKCLHEHSRPGQKLKLDPKAEAHLIAVACSKAPTGRRRWTLRLLADKAVELGLSASLSHEAVRQYLKKTNSSPGRRNNGVFRKSVRNSSLGWKMCSTSTTSLTIPSARKSALMKRANS
jgi:putative transposase